MILVSGPGALDEDHPFRFLAVRGTSKLSADEHVLELLRRHNIGRGSVAEMAQLVGVIGSGPGRLYDGSRFECLHPGRCLELHRELTGLPVDTLHLALLE